jgi:hypothetical protein
VKTIAIWRKTGGSNNPPSSARFTQVTEASVSDEDYPYVSEHKYGLNDGYPFRMEGPHGNQKGVFLHNEIAARMGLILKPGETVDHRDRVKLNCQRENFRAATVVGQALNKSTFKNSTSKVPGVSWHSIHKRWAAHISMNGETVHLGYFDSKGEAIMVRKRAEIERDQVMAMGEAV